MKNEIMKHSGELILKDLLSMLKGLAKQGIRSTFSLTEYIGNIIKISTYKNHNLNIHLFIRKR